MLLHLIFSQAVVGLQMAGKLKQPTFEFDSEEVRFNHRFAPFGVLLTPPPVKYSQFLVSFLIRAPVYSSLIAGNNIVEKIK